MSNRIIKFWFSVATESHHHLSMMPKHLISFLMILLVVGQSLLAQQSSPAQDRNLGIELTRQILSKRVEQIENACDLRQFKTAEDWAKHREVLRGQLAEMLGLPDLASRPTQLQAQVTGKLELDDIVVEKLHFQSSPGLYVTGNLYRPKQIDRPLPAVLYVCGHGQVKENGVSLGNKTHYQHHPAWLAKQGYVSMAIDTIQLGEIEGVHHGLYRFDRWDWPSRGYTPAGVEAWNAIRAVDYLVSRPEVDATKIGITGRSGGGAYSWYAAAIDQRISVAVPVAGITDLRDHVIDQVIRGHCDCMFFCNRYGWDYSILAALIHPRALLIGNTDEDPIFPLDGVFRVQQQVHAVYGLESIGNLGIHWTTGGHEDTQELQLGCFVWLDRHLLGSKRKLERAAVPLFAKSELKVFDRLPSDQHVTDVHDWFVPKAPDPSDQASLLPADLGHWNARCESIQEEISGSVFGRLPRFAAKPIEPTDPQSQKRPQEAQLVETHRRVSQGDWAITQLECESEGLPCSTLLRIESLVEPSDLPTVVLADDSLWDAWILTANPEAIDRQKVNGDGLVKGQILGEAWRSLIAQADPKRTTYLVFPQGTGPWRWDMTDKEGLNWRRSYLLVGWSLEGRQVAGALQSLQTICQEHSSDVAILKAGVQRSVHALHVALLDPNAIDALELHSLEKDAYSKGFVLSGVLRFCDMPEVLAAVSSRVPTRIKNAEQYRKMPLFRHLEKELGLPIVESVVR
jgi:dienelactone hydrolase